MSDLISRQAAIDALDAICERECEYSKPQRAVMCGACRLGSAFDVMDELPSAPTIDAVEVVRCKDCVALQYCRFAQGLGLDGFCSQGERRG